MKFKHLLFLVTLLSLFYLTANAQVKTSRTVVGSTGNSALVGKTLIQYTVGEPVVTTIQSSGFLLSQGFQQPEVTSGNEAEPVQIINYILFPNPTVSQTKLEFDLLNDSRVNIQVVNNAGQVLKNTTVNMFAGKITYPLSLSGLASGLYYVVLKIGRKNYTEKLIIQ